MFFNKKRAEDVPSTFNERLMKLESRLIKLEADILDLFTANEIIRNKVLRKIQFKKEIDEEDKPKDLYGGMLIPDRR